MHFCVLEYLYRDAANWKTYGEILLTGPWSEELRRQLKSTLEVDDLFVPEFVGLPSLRSAHAATYGRDEELDHGFHEFVELRPASEADLQDKQPLMSAEALLSAFRAASERWTTFGGPPMT